MHFSSKKLMMWTPLSPFENDLPMREETVAQTSSP